MAQDRAKEGVRLPYVLRHFDVSYLGICAPHVWIYCVAHRAGLDFGGVVIGIPLYIALSAFMLAVMLLAWKGKAQRVAPKLDWPLAALQAAATPLLLVLLRSDGAASATAAAVAAGIGVAWLYLQWAPFYAKLDVREAIACIFCAMAGPAPKVPIDRLPPVPAAVAQRRCRSSRPRWRAARNAGSRRHSASRGCSTTRTPRPSRGRSCSA